MQVINRMTPEALRLLFGGGGIPPAGALRVEVLAAGKRKGARMRVTICAPDCGTELVVICEGTIDVGASLFLTGLDKIFNVTVSP